MTGTQLTRVRWGVRGALLLGVATSVAANVLHALPNPISQAIAAWPPLALLLTVELISRIPVRHFLLSTVRLAATGFIASIAAWVSYWHMAGVVAKYGEVGAAPYLIPLSVDGLVVVASVCLVELTGRIQHPAIVTSPNAEPADASEDTPADIEPAAKTVMVPDIEPDAVREMAKPPQKARAPRKRDTGKAVAKLRARHPDLPVPEIAQRVGVTDRTVRRHLSAAA